VSGGLIPNKVHNMASGFGTSTWLNRLESIWMSEMMDREVAVRNGFS
jgi:hypothetical protein